MFLILWEEATEQRARYRKARAAEPQLYVPTRERSAISGRYIRLILPVPSGKSTPHKRLRIYARTCLCTV
jgi:hypothetical protein